jgi:hypothetical protein
LKGDSHVRGKINVGTALGLAALAATVLVSPAVAGASTGSLHAPPVGVAVAAGRATPGSAVDLYAWPSDAVLVAMKPGHLVPRKLLATATTNASGSYTLTVPAATLEAATVDSGYANLEIDSPGSGIWSFPYKTGMLPAQTPATETVNLGGKKKWPCGYMSNGQPYYVSGWSLLAQRKPAWTVVGQGYIAPSSRTRGDFVADDYNMSGNLSQASSLGIGISGYGVSAGYSTSGSKTSTENFTEGYHKSPKNSWFKTEFNTAQYRAECYGIPNTPVPVKKQHGACPKMHDESYVHMCLWRVSSTTWFGGSHQVHPTYIPPTPAKFCAPHDAGDHFNNDYGKAVKWSSGFTVGAAIDIKGVNLKATYATTTQTGYDAHAVMYFYFAHQNRLCGTNGSEAKAAILVAKK